MTAHYTPAEWQASTVRYLQSKFPEYVTRTSKKSWKERLDDALIRMNFLKTELVLESRHSIATWEDAIRSSTDKWSEEHHREVVSFLEAGGFMARKKESVISVVSGSDVIDELTLEGVQLNDLHPKAQHSPAHELEEIIADAEVAADPRYKVW